MIEDFDWEMRPDTTEVLAVSDEFYVEEVDSTISGHSFYLRRKNDERLYPDILSHEYSKRELRSDMRNQLFRDVKKLNELQPKVKALRALLQELDNNGDSE